MVAITAEGSKYELIRPRLRGPAARKRRKSEFIEEEEADEDEKDYEKRVDTVTVKA
jgi:hypothetical protein